MNKEVILNKLKSYEDEAMEFWKEIVDMGGVCKDKETMRELSKVLKAKFEEIGFDCELIEVGCDHPPVLVGNLKGTIDTKPVLFSGHYDTVFKYETYDHPAFKIEGENAHGPGVLDMKGGIVISWLIAKTLLALDVPRMPIRILYVGDEEVDREEANTISVIKENAAGCKFAFNMETGFLDRNIIIGRKGQDAYIVKVTGVAAHPGNAFDEGRNAIEEAARKIILLQELTPADRNFVLNVGVIKGGKVSNAIPDECTFELDIRFPSEEVHKEIDKEIRRICAMQFIDGTTTTVTQVGGLPPFETKEKEEKLYEYLCQVARDEGLTVPGKKIVGGASDAAYICQTDTPVLCATGVIGEFNHSPKEYAVISSLLERAELLIHAVLNQDKFVL